MTKKFFILAILIVVIGTLLTGCGSKEVILDAYVGDGMIAPMEAIKEIYEAQNPNVTIIYSFTGSGTLEETMRSLEQGDIYMPGAIKYINNMDEDGLVIASYPVAYHIPTIFVRAGDATVTSWDDLAKDGVRFAILSPDLASVGRVADSIISKSPLEEEIRANITTFPNDNNHAIQLLLDNKVDAVLIWRAAVEQTPELSIVEIPEEINEIKEIWIAVPTYTTAEDAALDFAKFCAGPEGQKVFIGKGFLIIE